MAVIPVSQTKANLLCTFACETLASRRYLEFAARAEKEGHQQAAVAFRCAARSKASHAEEHLKMLGGLGEAFAGEPTADTSHNLSAAIADEQGEHSGGYAGMARTAREEGFNEIADWFEMLAKAGRSHAGRFQRVRESLKEQDRLGFGTYASTQFIGQP